MTGLYLMNNTVKSTLNIPYLAVKKAQQGFTLIEVMLAMAVFAIAGVALVDNAGATFKNLSHIETQVMANWVASNQLVEVTVDKTWPPKNNKKGKVELAGREWFWSQQVIKTTDKNMRSVVIEVRLNEEQTLVDASLMTYVSKATP